MPATIGAFRGLAAGLGVITAASCAIANQSTNWSATGRQAVDVPERFWPDPAAGRQAAEAGSCLVSLIDSRNGVRLTLQQSGGGIGDYAVEPVDRYGVSPTEWLRLDCATMRPLGIVRQRR